MRFINALDLHKYYSNFNSFCYPSRLLFMCHLNWIPTGKHDPLVLYSSLVVRASKLLLSLGEVFIF